MNLVIDLLTKYYKEEKFNIFILITISLLLNLVQANGISYASAKIVESIEIKNSDNTYFFYYIIMGLLLVFIILNFIYKSYQNKILTKLRQWMRFQILRLLLLTNNDNMSETNFTKISSPINRVSSVCFMLFNDIISSILPTLSFLLILTIYFLYKNPALGLIFITGNLLLFFYIFMNRNDMMEKNANYEKYTVDNEAYLLEILNNVDKIIYRGQVKVEINTFWDKTKQSIEKALEFYSHLEKYGAVMHTIVFATIIATTWYSIRLYYQNRIELIFFMTFITMILLYREKMVNFVQMIPDFVEFVGRTRSVMKYFKDVKTREEIEEKTHRI
jgi:ABC-type multidrug transport system fused ATPase/permease subunit